MVRALSGRLGAEAGGPSEARGASPTPGRPRVSYSGEPGAFAEDAVRSAFADPIPLPVPGFREVFSAVVDGSADAGVLPIENVVNGTVRENYDLLLEHDLVIRAEVVVPVRLCLAALPGETLDTIERVYSHVQALGQAERFLRTRPWSLLTTYNTAGAGKLIADRSEAHAAAVLSPRAAGLFGLEVLADRIENDPANRTRFAVVGRSEPAAPGPVEARSPAQERPMRTTLALAVRNEPGALLRVLRVFSDAGLNMSTLESRPSRDVAWEYVFWIDLDTAVDAPPAVAALVELGSVTQFLRVLGSYPRAAGA